MTLLEINKAIIDQLKPHLTGNFASVKVIAEDLSEPISRPSIKVTMDGNSLGHYTGAITERNLTVRLYFFAASATRNKFDNIGMQETIEQTFFGGLAVGDDLLSVEAIDSTVSDGVLICSFDLVIYGVVPEDAGSGEPIEELDLTI